MNISEELKEARQNKNLTLDKAEEQTKIRKKYLIALEEGNYDIIPGTVYIKVFLKSYGNFLGLNGSKLAKEYEKILEEQKIDPNNDRNDEKSNFFKGKLMKIVIILIIISSIIFLLYSVFFADSLGLLNKNQNKVKTKIVTNETSNKTSTDNSNNNSSNKHDMTKKSLEQEENNSINNNKVNSNINVDKLSTKDNNVINQNDSNDYSLSNVEDNKLASTTNEKEKKIDNNNLHSNGLQSTESKANQKESDLSPESNPETQSTLNSTLNKKLETKETDKKDITNSADENTTKDNVNTKEVKNKKTIKLIAGARTWIRITEKNKIIFEGFMNDGDTKTFTQKNDAEGLILKVGNAIAIKVEKDGKITGPLGKSGEVLKKEIKY